MKGNPMPISLHPARPATALLAAALLLVACGGESAAEDGANVSHLYVVRAKDRESLRAHLAASGVASDVHYPVPDHRQPGAGHAPPEGLPITERACAEVLSLPCYPELTAAEIDAVAAACNRWQPATRS